MLIYWVQLEMDLSQLQQPLVDWQEQQLKQEEQNNENSKFMTANTLKT